MHPQLQLRFLSVIVLAMTIAGCGSQAKQDDQGPPSMGLIPGVRADGPPSLGLIPPARHETTGPPNVSAAEVVNANRPPALPSVSPAPALPSVSPARLPVQRASAPPVHPQPELAQRYLHNAEQLLAQKKLQPAIDALDAAILNDPGYAAAYAKRAYAYNWLRMYEKAIKDCDKAIELNSELPEAYRHRASANLGIGMVKRAIDDSTHAIELNPRDYDAYWVRADACTSLHDYKQAADDLTTALQFVPASVHPIHEELLQCRAEAFKKLGRGDLALKDLRDAKRN